MPSTVGWASEEGIPPMVLRVQCYAGRKADERPVKFQMGDANSSSKKFSTNGTGRTRFSSNCARMTAISISFGTTVRRTNGSWNPSDVCGSEHRQLEALPLSLFRFTASTTSISPIASHNPVSEPQGIYQD